MTQGGGLNLIDSNILVADWFPAVEDNDAGNEHNTAINISIGDSQIKIDLGIKLWILLRAEIKST